MRNTHSQHTVPNLTNSKFTGKVLFSDGTTVSCQGFGVTGIKVGELCFNTSMTGYQEIITDPSYCNQIVCFTFPHIGNVGVNIEDFESKRPALEGIITRLPPTKPSNWRSENDLGNWIKEQNLIGITGVDTRLLTQLIRKAGAPNIAIFHSPDGEFDMDLGKKKLNSFVGLTGLDLAPVVTSKEELNWSHSLWNWPEGFPSKKKGELRVAALDFGAKRNILRCLTEAGCKVRNFPAETRYEQVLDWKPDGIFLSNGPGDPAATAEYIVPLIKRFVQETDLPIFGICLGHQMLALALGGKTKKMNHGHHGANHPVQELSTKKVEITTMNHGFAVESDLPPDVEETHISLFDGTNCGLQMKNKPVFSVQFHPEASPGPQDSFYLFEKFQTAMQQRKSAT